MQAVQYLNSSDLRGFTDLINCEDVEAGGQQREHWINAAAAEDGATLLELAITQQKIRFAETLLAAGARHDLVSAATGLAPFNMVGKIAKLKANNALKI